MPAIYAAAFSCIIIGVVDSSVSWLTDIELGMSKYAAIANNLYNRKKFGEIEKFEGGF